MSWPAGPDASSQMNSLAAAQWELAAIGPVASAAEPARVLDFANAAAIISFNEGSSSAGETRAPTLECGMMAAAMAVTVPSRRKLPLQTDHIYVWQRGGWHSGP